MVSIEPHWHSDKGNSIQDGESFRYRWPIATAVLFVLVLAPYFLENHPNTGIHHGQYLLSAFSVYTGGQLINELVPLAVGGFIVEQFINRWKMVVFYIITAPITVFIAETYDSYHVVLGMSGGTMGLLGFGLMCLVWYLFEDKESKRVFVVMAAVLSICAMLVLSSVYGYLVVHFGLYDVNFWFSSNTAYIAHVAGSIIGVGWWSFEHYSAATL